MSPIDPKTILSELNVKFQTNFNSAIKGSFAQLSDVERKIRALSELRDRLKANGSKTREELLVLLDEVFADLVISLYLSYCAIDRPASMSLRRATELAVAFFYLWDNASKYWAWKDYDKDLSYKEMLDELSSSGYATFLQKECKAIDGGHLIQLKNAYRDLSNQVHGKISTFETSLERRFSHDPADLTQHIELMNRVLDAILGIGNSRFPNI
jgi:hypothetical protein